MTLSTDYYCSPHICKKMMQKKKMEIMLYFTKEPFTYEKNRFFFEFFFCLFAIVRKIPLFPSSICYGIHLENDIQLKPSTLWFNQIPYSSFLKTGLLLRSVFSSSSSSSWVDYWEFPSIVGRKTGKS